MEEEKVGFGGEKVGFGLAAMMMHVPQLVVLDLRGDGRKLEQRIAFMVL